MDIGVQPKRLEYLTHSQLLNAMRESEQQGYNGVGGWLYPLEKYPISFCMLHGEDNEESHIRIVYRVSEHTSRRVDVTLPHYEALLAGQPFEVPEGPPRFITDVYAELDPEKEADPVTLQGKTLVEPESTLFDGVELEERWKCPGCEQFFQEDELEPAYECSSCGNQFLRSESENDNHQCPECRRFAGLITRFACPDGCYEECEVISGADCPECGEFVEDGNFTDHQLTTHG